MTTNTPTVAVVNVFGHTFHTNVTCPTVQKYRAKVRFLPQRDAILYFGMVGCDRCRTLDTKIGA